MDFYGFDNNSVAILLNITNRLKLLNEYYTHNNLIVAFDYDNTVYDYHNTGDDSLFSTVVKPLVIKTLKRCKKLGCTLVLYTCNNSKEKIDDMLEYCKKNGIEPDYINETPKNIPFGHEGSKIYFNILLDDRAGILSALSDLIWVIDQIEVNNENA